MQVRYAINEAIKKLPAKISYVSKCWGNSFTKLSAIFLFFGWGLSRRGNNGGFQDPSSQKILGLTEICLGYFEVKWYFCKIFCYIIYIIAKWNVGKYLLLYLLPKWNVVGNLPSFSLNLVIIGLATTALLQKIFGR